MQSRLYLVSLLSTLTLYMVITIGGVVRAIGAGMACGPDWPTCKGYVIPPDVLDPFVLSEYLHRVLAMLATLFVTTGFVIAWVKHRSDKRVLLWSTLTMALLITQVLVGMLVVVLELHYAVSAVHLSLATATFGSSIVMTLSVSRIKA